MRRKRVRGSCTYLVLPDAMTCMRSHHVHIMRLHDERSSVRLYRYREPREMRFVET